MTLHKNGKYIPEGGIGECYCRLDSKGNFNFKGKRILNVSTIYREPIESEVVSYKLVKTFTAAEIHDVCEKVDKLESIVSARVSTHENEVKSTIQAIEKIMNETNAKVSVLIEKLITKEMIDKEREEIKKQFKEANDKLRKELENQFQRTLFNRHQEIRKEKVHRIADTFELDAKTNNLNKQLDNIDATIKQRERADVVKDNVEKILTTIVKSKF